MKSTATSPQRKWRAWHDPAGVTPHLSRWPHHRGHCAFKMRTRRASIDVKCNCSSATNTHLMPPAELARLVPPRRNLLRIYGTPAHTSSLFHLRTFRTVPRRPRIARNKYRTPGGRIRNCLSARQRTFGTIQRIHYKAGYSPSS